MRLLSYSPSHCPPELLEAITAAEPRQRLITTLVDAVRAEVGAQIHQHQLLIGPRGSGKTHTLALLAHRLRGDGKLRRRVLPIVLPEEVVAHRPADLLIKILERLEADFERGPAAEIEHARAAGITLRTALDRLTHERDDDEALTLAGEVLEESARKLGRLLVPIVENLDTLLYAGPSLSRKTALAPQWGLRKFLQTSPGVLLVAAAPTSFGEMQDPGAPFHDFFRVHPLGQLAPVEMLDVLRRRLDEELKGEDPDPARRGRLEKLSQNYKARVPQLRGLLAITGGLPRFGHLIFDFLVATDLAGISELLSRFLDDQTPYFQSRLDPRIIPEAELEILDTLACAEGPLPTGEIATRVRGGTPNQVATYLKRLMERGLVRSVGTGRKNVRYDVAEPLFRVWRRFRIGRSEREQIIVLAEFVAAMFKPADLRADREALIGNQKAALRLRVLDEAIRLSESRQATPVLRLAKMAKETVRIIKAAEKEYFSGSLTRAFELYGQAITRIRDAGDRRPLARQLGPYSDAALLVGHVQEALAAAEEGEHLANEVGDADSRAYCIASRGSVLFRLGQNQPAIDALVEAERLYKEVGNDLGRADCVRQRGSVLFILGQDQPALDALVGAERLFQKERSDLGRANCIYERGRVLFGLGQNQAALDAFADAERLFQKIHSKLGRANCIVERGSVLFRLGQNQPALDALVEAERLYEEGGTYLGRGRAMGARGLISFAQGELTEAVRLTVVASELGRKGGSEGNVEITVASGIDALTEHLGKVSGETLPALLREASALFSAAETSDRVRSAVARLAVALLDTRPTDEALRLLPILEATLPSNWSTLLLPARLAAGILAGTLPTDLPDQPEEMRRVVTEVLEQVRAKKTDHAPK